MHLHHYVPMAKLDIAQLAVTYRRAIAQNLFCIINDRLVYLKPVDVSSNHLCRIVVPLSLRRLIFDVMHSSPAAGHIGEYKTLYRIKLRFIWHRMRKYIKVWVKQCIYCMLTYVWRRRGQEVMFSWPVSSLFTITHAGLWMPGHFKDRNGNVALMNVICDMTKFVIVVPVSDEVASTLAEHFMYHVLIKFGICHLVILDDGSPFKGVFSTMCKALRINYDILDKRTHKGLLVKNFHRFLNKTVTIAVEDRGSNDVFVAADVAAEYAWNTSPIDGTDIFCSVPTLGRELQFPIDVDISTLPLLVSNNNDSVVSYLCLTDSNRHFATAILKILIENRLTPEKQREDSNSFLFCLCHCL